MRVWSEADLVEPLSELAPDTELFTAAKTTLAKLIPDVLPRYLGSLAPATDIIPTFDTSLSNLFSSSLFCSCAVSCCICFCDGPAVAPPEVVSAGFSFSFPEVGCRQSSPCAAFTGSTTGKRAEWSSSSGGGKDMPASFRRFSRIETRDSR